MRQKLRCCLLMNCYPYWHTQAFLYGGAMLTCCRLRTQTQGKCLKHLFLFFNLSFPIATPFPFIGLVAMQGEDVPAPFNDTQCAGPQGMAIHSSPCCSLQSPDDDTLIALRKSDNLKQNHRQRQTHRHMWVAVAWTETDFSGFKAGDRLQRLSLSLNHQ